MLPLDVRPACDDDLPLVDAAFQRGKKSNEAARELARKCRTCPCARECLITALHGREDGVWAGTRRVKSASQMGRLKVVKIA